MANPKFSNIVDPFGGINDPFAKTPEQAQQAISVPQEAQPQETLDAEPERQSLGTDAIEDARPGFLSRMFPEESRGGQAAGVGAMVGGALGAPAGPAGIIAGGALGAAIGRATYGGITGENFEDQWRGATEEARQDAMWSAAFMTAIPAAKVLGPAVNQVLNLFGDNQKARELADIAKQLGIPVGSVIISDKKIVKAVPSVSGIFPVAGAPARRSVRKSVEAAVQRKEEFLEMVGPNVSLQQAGIDMTTAARNSGQNFRRQSKSLYDGFYKLSEDLGNPAIIDVTDLKATAAALTSRTNRPPTKDPVTGAVGVLDKPKPTGFEERLEEYAGRLLNLQKEISPSHFRELQIDLNKLSRQPDAEKHLIGPLKKALEDSFQSGKLVTGKISDDDAMAVREALDTANEFYAIGMARYNTPQADAFGRVDTNIFESPHFQAGNITQDRVAEVLLRSKSPEGIRNLRDIVGSDNMRQLAAEHMHKASSQSVKHLKDSGETFSFSAFEKHLGLNTEDGRRTMQEFLKDTPLKMEELEKLIKLGKRIDTVHIPEAAAMIQRRMTLGGAGAGVTLATGGPMGLGGYMGFLYISRAANTLVSSPNVVRWLNHAMDESAAPHLQRAAIGKLMNELNRDPNEPRTFRDVQHEKSIADSLMELREEWKGRM